MKLAIVILIALVAFSFNGCTGHHKADEFNITLLEQEANEVLRNNVESNMSDVEVLPNYIKSLNPISVYITNVGIYIKLEQSFVEESGVFIPKEGIQVTEGLGYDPNYIKIGGSSVYSYHIKG
ncbi:MAG: hypothetical protein KKC46_10050 [Proteobacteria bacterium]|nr:hypothetical protein [Pseudomonadota bacterium]